MLGEQQRFEAAGLGFPGELRGVDRVVGAPPDVSALLAPRAQGGEGRGGLRAVEHAADAGEGDAVRGLEGAARFEAAMSA